MTKKRNVITFLMIMFIFSPYWISAHVKWFTKVEQPEKKAMELIVDPLFIMVACCSMILLAGLPWISEEIMKWKWSQRIELKLHSYQNYSQHILKYGTALALTIQICSGTIFVP
ncbi:hypothetical protein [Bacillus cereus]|uniref:hypothetical protein n=1 Tax=Bacillus cereus TaxID=1396 RepID=UPI000BF74994|nr:hypothetical protein [Bacillus cereus]PFA69407.1 hypothetical protein CN403_20155 [Bacillus cereus]